MTLLKIIATGLAANGYSGLVCPGVCGCEINELSPGGCLDDGCLPGHKHTHSKRPDDWIISTSEEQPPDEEIADWCLWNQM